MQLSIKSYCGLVALLALSALNQPFSNARGQGSLTPPGAPAPTMKSLDQIEPRTPISALPYGISTGGSYYLTTSLTGVGGNLNGINISSGNVTLDLNGFTLQGVPGSGAGIRITATITNLTIRNGTLTGWGSHGLDAYSSGFPRNMVFEGLTLSGNGSAGIYAEADSIMRNCLAIGNAGDGFHSYGGEVTDCIARNNGGYGIEVVNGNVRRCFVDHNNSVGVSLTSSRAVDCIIQTNNSYGVICNGPGDELRGCRITGNQNVAVYCNADNGANVIADCLISANGSYGIYTVGLGRSLITGNQLCLNFYGGIVIGDSNNHIENNNVITFNGAPGISVTSSGYTNNVVIKNVVGGGGSAANNYFNPGNNDFGPIGTAATATSPWANISH